jgi:hypothetical protein
MSRPNGPLSPGEKTLRPESLSGSNIPAVDTGDDLEDDLYEFNKQELVLQELLRSAFAAEEVDELKSQPPAALVATSPIGALIESAEGSYREISHLYKELQELRKNASHPITYQQMQELDLKGGVLKILLSEHSEKINKLPEGVRGPLEFTYKPSENLSKECLDSLLKDFDEALGEWSNKGRELGDSIWNKGEASHAAFELYRSLTAVREEFAKAPFAPGSREKFTKSCADLIEGAKKGELGNHRGWGIISNAIGKALTDFINLFKKTEDKSRYVISPTDSVNKMQSIKATLAKIIEVGGEPQEQGMESTAIKLRIL